MKEIMQVPVARRGYTDVIEIPLERPRQCTSIDNEIPVENLGTAVQSTKYPKTCDFGF